MFSFFEIWVSAKYLLPKTREKFFSIITIFSFLGISLGVATLIIVMSVMNGFRDELTSKILGINGHMKVQPINNYKILNYEDLIEDLYNKVEEISVNKVLVDQALLTKNQFSTGVILKGIEKKYFEERKIFENKIPKEILIKFDDGEGIIIGDKLKDKLNIKYGESVNILSSNNLQTVLGNIPRSGNFKVIGSFKSGMYEYDTALIFFPISLLQNFLNLSKKIDFFEIQLDHFDEIDLKREEIKKNLPKYFKVSEWRELNPSLFNALEVEKNVMFLILMLIIIVAAFNLISSLIILVSMKKKDIGVLSILGVKKNQLLRIFMINGLIIGFLGTFLGLVLGLLFCYNINEIKTFIEFFLESNLFAEEIYFFTKLPVIIDHQQIIKIVLISIFLSFVATIYPAIKASKVDPINLIKWE